VIGDAGELVAGDADPADGVDPFAAAVTAEAGRLRIREAAARRLRSERTGVALEPPIVSLAGFLEIPDEPLNYRIDDLLPVGGRVILAAAYKSGKSTLTANLVRVLVDGGDFLDRFPVHKPAGRVVLIDDELDPRMLRRWLREQGIENTDRVDVVALRGQVGSFDILDPDCRARWAARLRDARAGFIVLDCLRPVLDALGLSEDKDAGRFLVAFDALLAEAGISEAVVNHHAGHTGERSRGDSRLRDWPDVEWKLVREQTDDGEVQSDARRYFSAYGRDVDVPEGLLHYDGAARRLSLSGGTRQQTAGDALIPDVLTYLNEHPGESGRSIEAAMTAEHGHPQKRVRQAIRRGVARLDITTRSGPRNAVLHYANPVPNPSQTVSAASAAPPRQRTQSECGSASIGDALHSLTGAAAVVRQPPHSPVLDVSTWRPLPNFHANTRDAGLSSEQTLAKVVAAGATVTWVTGRAGLYVRGEQAVDRELLVSLFRKQTSVRRRLREGHGVGPPLPCAACGEPTTDLLDLEALHPGCDRPPVQVAS